MVLFPAESPCICPSSVAYDWLLRAKYDITQKVRSIALSSLKYKSSNTKKHKINQK